MIPKTKRVRSLPVGSAIGNPLFVNDIEDFENNGFIEYTERAGLFVAYNLLKKEISRGQLYYLGPEYSPGLFSLASYEKCTLDNLIELEYLSARTYKEVYDDLKKAQDYPQAVWDSLKNAADRELEFYIITEEGDSRIKVKKPSEGNMSRFPEIKFGIFNPVPQY